MNYHKIFMTIGFLAVLGMLLTGAFAWFDSYGFRYQIISNSTSIFPLSINDTAGINSTIIWAYIDNSSYLYSTSANIGTPITVANSSDIADYWENETSRTGNNSNSMWNETGAIAVYHFGEGTGTIAYDSSNGNNASFIGSGQSYISGQFGNAINLTGSNGEYLSTSNSPSLALQGTETQMTWEAWIYATDSARDSNSGYIFKGNLANNQGVYSFGSFSGGGNIHASLRLNGNIIEGSGQLTGTSILNLNQWYYIAGVYNGTNLIVYVNGTQDGINSYSTNLSADTNNISIGIYYGIGGQEWKGRIDEVRIYNRSLSASEILNHYYNGINNMTRLGAEDLIPVVPATQHFSLIEFDFWTADMRLIAVIIMLLMSLMVTVAFVKGSK